MNGSKYSFWHSLAQPKAAAPEPGYGAEFFMCTSVSNFDLKMKEKGPYSKILQILASLNASPCCLKIRFLDLD